MLSCLYKVDPGHIIGVLIDKSLIKIEGDQVLIHDLIEDMGKEIVRQESPDEPGERSRLWFYQDILHVLKQNTGTDKVKVVVLDLPEGDEVQIQWNGKAFMKMKNLKMLLIKNASFSKCPIKLPKRLRWLKWKGYPFKCLPYNIWSTELDCHDLSCSNFDTLQPFTKEFHSLSRMNFRNCKFLQQTPDLSGVPNLRELWLDGCTNLVEIHHSVGCLNKLKELSAIRCNNLEIFPPNLRLTSLEHLNLFGCSSLYSFLEILVEMKYMRTLDLGRTAITVLPSSICNLIGLETLNLEECPYLRQLPATSCLLPNLWELNANFSKLMTHIKMREGGQEESLDCYALSLKLKHFCFSNCNLSDDSLALCLSYFTNMIHLDLSFNRLTTLPACVKECHHLKYLLLDNCKLLQHIEEMPPNLEKFSAICCLLLTKSSKSKVFYQAINLQPGKRNFIFPAGKFPENLDNYSRGSCVSFWVRDVFPTIFLWILVKHDQDFLSNCTLLVHVNDAKLDISSGWLLLSAIKMGHLYVCDVQSMFHKAEFPHRYKWNHVKVSIKTNAQEIKNERDKFHFALHVYKQQNNSATIRFLDPRTTYVDSNPWQRVQQPQDWEELEDNMPYRDLAPNVGGLKAKRAVLPSRWTYDVLLGYSSYYECSSLVSRLYNSLCERGIHAFVNHELLKTSGKELMQECRAAVIVISKSYASSTSFFDGLAAILECCAIECRFFCPIFYDKEPFEPRGVFARLEERFKHNKRTFRKWISIWSGGHRYTSRNNAEEKFMTGNIVREVCTRIDRFPLPYGDVSESLEFGDLEEAISLLDVGSNRGVKMVGICGTVASTMARAVCHSIARHFEDLWYFSVYREIARVGDDFSLDDFHVLIKQPWFSQKKILVIMDDVEELDQLRAVRECDRFGQGSRIIVATGRGRQLLVSLGVQVIYDAEEAAEQINSRSKEGAFLEEKEPQSIHSSTEKVTKRNREDTDSSETQTEGNKCHA